MEVLKFDIRIRPQTQMIVTCCIHPMADVPNVSGRLFNLCNNLRAKAKTVWRLTQCGRTNMMQSCNILLVSLHVNFISIIFNNFIISRHQQFPHTQNPALLGGVAILMSSAWHPKSFTNSSWQLWWFGGYPRPSNKQDSPQDTTRINITTTLNIIKL